jgi:hypothetical protein
MPVWLTYVSLTACAALLAFGFYVDSERGQKRFAKWTRYASAFQVAAIVLAYLVVRPGTGDDGPEDIAQAKAQSRPIFVDLYSNF